MANELTIADFQATYVPEPTPVVQPAVELSKEQQEALEAILSTDKNVFLTGEAGTGKSVLIRALAARRDVALAATTGLAALNVGGTTVDRLFNLEREGWTIRNRKTLTKNMTVTPDLIVIDEISMAGFCMMNVIRDCAVEFDKRLIMVGDLAQASPVKDTWCTVSSLFLGSDRHKLSQVHRQKDPEFVAALRSIRHGEPDESTARLMNSCVGKPDDRHTVLFAINKMVDRFNSQKLGELRTGGPDVVCQTYFKDHRSDHLREKFPTKPGQIRSFIEDSKLADGEVLRIGARVMMTKNSRDELGYVNGDCGELLDMIDMRGRSVNDCLMFKITSDNISHLVVKLDRWDEPINVARSVVTSKDAESEPVYSAFGFPVRLGYAATLHRCQGMSLDNVYVDLDTISMMKTKESTHGLVYVATSRARTREGLRIARWTPEHVYCAPEVKPYL